MIRKLFRGLSLKQEPAPAGAAPIMGNFNLSAQLPNGQSASVAGYIYEGESLESLNARLDLMQEAIQRQRRRAEIPELEAKLEQTKTALRQATDHFNELKDRAKSDKLNSQEKLHLANFPVTIRRIKEEIDKGEAAVSEAKAQFAA